MPNQTISFTPYSAEQARIEQNQKLAELLQSQADESTRPYTYNGIQAPIPPAAGLNTILSKALSGYMMNKGLEDQKALGEKAQSDARDWITKLTQGTPITATPADVEDRDQGISMGSGAAPISIGQTIGSQPMSKSDRLALLLQGTTNPMTSQTAQSLIANDQGLERQKELQEAQFQQQKDLEAQREAFQKQQTESSQAFQRSMGTPIMVPDATSPTGFKYVRPEEAINKPAYNPNALFSPVGTPSASGTVLHGDDFLKTLSPQAAETVKGLADGRIPVSPMMVRTPQGMQMLAAASQYDPSFDASNYQARAAQRKNYEGGGKQFQELQAINTVAGHLNDFMKASDALGNSSMPIWNSIANTVSQATGNPQVDKFNTVRQAVTNELSKAYRGGMVTEGDVKEWQQNISASKSPAQLKAVIGQLNDLLSSKRQALEEGFKQTMGPVQLPSEFSATNNRTKAIFDQISNWANGGVSSSPSSSGNADIDALLKKYQ